jgi:hypothetical protein
VRKKTTGTAVGERRIGRQTCNFSFNFSGVDIPPTKRSIFYLSQEALLVWSNLTRMALLVN